MAGRAVLDYSKQRAIDEAREEAKKFDTRALNGRMLQIVEGFGYDSDDRAYQYQNMSLFPPRLGGWVLVCNKPLPMTVAGEKQTKKVLRIRK